ncbi:MAG: glycosyltransferase family 2 protein [Ruminococcus sp.]
MESVILIPAYNPENTLCTLSKQLKELSFEVLIVNDGSNPEYDNIFNKASEYATVIGYSKNRGKGYALKKGIEYIKNNYREINGFITADADGQHSVEDIIKISRALKDNNEIILGTRDLKSNIPLRSKIGNDLSRVVYSLVTGKYLYDNQTGLRAFPMWACDFLLSVKGEKYEYEINVAVKAAYKNYKIIEIPIKTIYDEGNTTSHFRPVIDTLRIQGHLIKSGIIFLITYILYLSSIGLIFGFNLEHKFIYTGICTVLFYILLILIVRIKRGKKSPHSKGFNIPNMIFISTKYLTAAVISLLFIINLNSPVLGGIIALFVLCIMTLLWSKFCRLLEVKRNGTM